MEEFKKVFVASAGPLIKSATYVKSSPSLALCPEVSSSEFAFVGRSNVGKSSLINYLTNHSKLADTSKVPGKTKLINHYLINQDWFLVDLPGYGYAKSSKTLQQKWADFTCEYLLGRENLVMLFVLVDGSIAPQDKDMDFINWCIGGGVPISIVRTKLDKTNIKEALKLKKDFMDKLALEVIGWEKLKIFEVSSHGKEGREELLGYIETIR